jgi:hypothetical protein
MEREGSKESYFTKDVLTRVNVGLVFEIPIRYLDELEKALESIPGLKLRYERLSNGHLIIVDGKQTTLAKYHPE